MCCYINVQFQGQRVTYFYQNLIIILLYSKLRCLKVYFFVIYSSLLEPNFAAKDEEYHQSALNTKRFRTIALDNRISVTMLGIAACPKLYASKDVWDNVVLCLHVVCTSRHLFCVVLTVYL